MDGNPSGPLIAECRDVGLYYRLVKPAQSLHDFLIKRRKPQRKTFWALRHVNLRIHAGEVVGVVGCNGAGKSTLCRLLGGLMEPDEGSLAVPKQTSAVFSLGSGMKADLSGRENAKLMAMFMRVGGGEMDRVITEVEAFTDIGLFFDQPVQSYSAGMKARLGFAVATAIQPDLLILDEIIRAGDESFRVRSEQRIHHLVNSSSAAVIVSHSMTLLKSMCTRGLWLDKGQVVMTGPMGDVIDRYMDSAKRERTSGSAVAVPGVCGSRC